MDYGHFSEDGKEYLITRVPTPRGWDNWVGNRRYGLKVEETGAGYSVLPVAPGNRVTFATGEQRFGKVFYLRDRDSGAHWSLTWQPVGGPYDRFVCRHGQGYTIFEMSREGVETSLRVFVPLDDPVEIWTATIRNTGDARRRLTLFPYLEWHVAPYMRPWDNYHNYLHAHWVSQERLIVASLTDPVQPWVTYHAFAGIAPKAARFDADRETFVGSGSMASPAAVVEGTCRNSDMPGDGRAIAAFEVEVELHPGQEKTVHLLIGFEPEPRERARLRDTWLEPKRIEEEFGRVLTHWEGVFVQPHIQTPDPRLDRMTNIWLKANVIHLTQSLREGMRGYRDTLQDAIGVVSFDPARARELLLTALSYQYADGHALRQFSYYGAPHDLRVYNDSPLWMVLALARYLKETGDFAFLDEEAPFFESDQRGSVFDHARRAVDWIDGRRGRHDLIRVDRGDWCDGFDQAGWKGKGVSFWLSQAFHLALIEMADLCALRREADYAARYREKAERLRASVEEHGWDGEWYLWAISDRGRKLGTKGDAAMEIYINTQAWAAIGRTADPERIALAFNAADQRLESKYGPLMIAPPFHSYDPDVGRLSVMPPGCGENGTVYVHAAVFYFLANLVAKRPDRALEILRKIAPLMEEQDPQVTLAAPYAYVNSYVGPCHPAHEGRTLTNWYTSSASWTLFAITDWMLGVRPTHEGLLIDPCLPSEWERASLTRKWRGAEYHVEITKPRGLVTGRVEVAVDGKAIEGNLVKPFGDGRRHRVEVSLASG